MDIDTCNCSEHFPQYGVAPHECYFRKEGGFKENKIGESTILSFDTWPDNFLTEINPDENIQSQISYGLCGVYFCPECKKEMKEFESSDLWSKEKLIAAIEENENNLDFFIDRLKRIED